MKKQFQCIPVLLLWLALTLAAWCLPARAESDSERRPLAQWPELSGKTLANGSFMTNFEDYTLDQFPLRDGFRGLKTIFHTRVLGQQDSNGIYLYRGYGAKQEYPLNESSVQHALKRFHALYEKHLTGSRVFMAVVPDKHHYLAPVTGRPSMDYAGLYAMVEAGMPWAQHIDLRPTLQLEDYYRTDTHWRQEQLPETAGVICQALGIPVPRAEDYTLRPLEQPFYGVYHGQSALPLEPETMYLLESPVISQCTVYDHETGKTMSVYDLTKLTSRDLYDVYLGGARALLTIENPAATTDRELIVFRDSFGSSLIPLLLHGYSRITVVDIRYISPDFLDRFIEFNGQDVLLLYSTLILNNSSAIK